jgi:hypothetical protein
LGNLNLVINFELAQGVNNPGVEVPVRQVSLQLGEFFPVFSELGLDLVDALDRLLDRVQLFLGADLRIGQSPQVFVLAFDHSQAQRSQGRQRDDYDQNQVLLLFFWQFLEVHRVLSGVRHSRLKDTASLPLSATCGELRLPLLSVTALVFTRMDFK